MPIQTVYYQVGGRGGHLKKIPDTRLLRSQDDQGLCLILGILPNGASCLLLPGLRYDALRWRHPNRGHYTRERFMSLSPIHFSNVAELESKLTWFSSKKTKKNSERTDQSKANRSYVITGDGLSDMGKARSSFELQRVFVLSRPMLARLDSSQGVELALQQLPEHVNVISLCYNAWGADTRSLKERETDPKVLDIGWTAWSKPAQWNNFQLTQSDTTYLVVEEERFLGNQGLKRIECEYASTTYERRSEIAWRVTAALTGRYPVVLLVHDEACTLRILRALGIDTTAWVSGIAGLLYGDARGHGRTESRSSRSRSPGRRGSDTQDRERHASGTPVYVVDVRSLYLTLRQIEPTTDSVPINSRGLGVQLEPPKDKPGAVTPTLIAQSDGWWCAGTESLLLGKMWYSMACGPNIDDQRVMRWPRGSTGVAVATPNNNAVHTPVSPAVVETDNASDDDVDPNDIVLAPTSAPASSSKPSIGERGLRLMHPDGWDCDYDTE